MGEHALSAERVKKIEQTVVMTMEREMRQMLLEQQRQRILDIKRSKQDSTSQSVERRKELARRELIERHEAKGAEHRARSAQVKVFQENERQKLFQYDQVKRQRSALKQEEIKRSREEMFEQVRQQGELKKEQMRQVKEELARIQEVSKAVIVQNLQKHDETLEKHVENRKLELEEHKRVHQERQVHHENKREKLKQDLQQANRRLEARIFEKYERADRVKIDRDEKVASLNNLKDEVRTRKENLRDMIAWAERTQRFDQVEQVLVELKTQSVSQDYEGYVDDLDGTLTPRSLSARPTLSPATLKSAMKGTRSPRLNASSLRAASVYSTPEKIAFTNASSRPQSAPRSRSLGVTRSPMQRTVATSPVNSNYDHLMTYYKARVAALSPA